jgi:hypothetical protein
LLRVLYLSAKLEIPFTEEAWGCKDFARGASCEIKNLSGMNTLLKEEK